MYRPGLREIGEAGFKFLRGGELRRVQLGIAAGEPAAVAMLRWRRVGQGGEEGDFAARAAPAFQDMGVEEAEGGIAGDGDAPAGRRQELCCLRRRGERGGEGE